MIKSSVVAQIFSKPQWQCWLSEKQTAAQTNELQTLKPHELKTHQLKPHQLKPHQLTVPWPPGPPTLGPLVSATTTSPEAENHVIANESNANEVAVAASDFSIAGRNVTKYSLSANAGATWADSFVPLDGGSFPNTNDGAYQFNSDPVLATNSRSAALGQNLYLTCIYFDGGGSTRNGLYVLRGDFASGFSLANIVGVAVNPSPTTTIFEDKPWLTARRGSNEVYISWSRFVSGSSRIVFSRSSDSGATWSPAIQLSPAAQNGGVQFSQVQVDPVSGYVYVLWSVFFLGGVSQLWMAVSTTRGFSFLPAAPFSVGFTVINFSTVYRKNSIPSLTVFRSDVYASVAAMVGTMSEIFNVRSWDYGRHSFGGALIRVDDAITGQRLFNQMCTDASGAIWVCWYDTRLNPTAQSDQLDVFMSRSADRGGSWEPNTRLTNATFSVAGFTFIGDYFGIASTNLTTHPAWTQSNTFVFTRAVS